MNWTEELDKQLSWLWENHLRRRWDGLTDEEYLWEPVAGMWSVRPRGEGVAVEVGSGDYIIDFAFPEPSPPPVTTIAWRFGHLLVGVFGSRLATYFGGRPVQLRRLRLPHHGRRCPDPDRRPCMPTGSPVFGSLDDAALAEPCAGGRP